MAKGILVGADLYSGSRLSGGVCFELAGSGRLLFGVVKN